MRPILMTCSLIALTWLLPTVSLAQNRNTTGGGNTGFGNTGSSGFGGTGNSGFGSNGSSGFGGTGGGFGTNGGTGGFGSGGQNGFGANGQTGFGGQNQFGANGNNGGILGRNTNQNQFLGRNVQNQGIGGNNNFGGGNRGGGNRRTGANALNNGGGAGGGANANQAPLVRPRQKVAFDWPQPKPETVQVALETRLSKLSLKSPGMKNVTLSIEDKGEVVLRGAVDSEAEAKKAEMSLRLEPGVWKVRNELTFPKEESEEPTDE